MSILKIQQMSVILPSHCKAQSRIQKHKQTNSSPVYFQPNFMVRIHLKRGDESCFLWDTTTSINVGELIRELVALHNKRLQLARLVGACQDLLEYGPLRPESEQGLSEEQIEALALKEKSSITEEETPAEESVVNGKRVLLRPDPTGRRVGYAVTSDFAAILQKTLENAKAVIDKNLVLANHPLNKDAIFEAFSDIKGAVTIIYPEGLPEWDPVREVLDDREDLSGTAASKEVLDEKVSTLWWAGKQMLPAKALSDYVGKNEKTKIIAKLQKEGAGAPVREAPLTEKDQKEMMAYYYRKQELDKKLMENDEDDTGASVWADPKSLKSSFNGIGSVSWRPT